MKKAIVTAVIAAVLIPAAAMPASAKGTKCVRVTILDVNGNPYSVCQVKP